MNLPPFLRILNQSLGIELVQVPQSSQHDFEDNKGYKTDDEGHLIGLYLSNSNLKNIDFLEDYLHEVQHIKELNISSNGIKDIAKIRLLTNLIDLNLRNNQIVDISPLRTLEKLEKINLRKNDINNIDDLSSLSNLEVLDLGFNPISDCTLIGDLSCLTDLRLEQTNLKDYNFIYKLSNLKILYIERTPSKNVDFLVNSTNLIEVSILRGEINDISALKKLKNIERLNLNLNAIEDISIIKYLTNLTYLNIGHNKVKSLDAIKHLKKLRHIDCNYNQINNIEAISNLSELQVVFLDSANDGNELDCTPLKKLINITDLSLEHTRLSDLSFLNNLENIGALWLKNNEIKDLGPLRFLKTLDAIDLRHNPIEKLPDWITELNIPIRWIDEIRRTSITLFDNPIETPPIPIIKQGNGAVKRYFDKIFKQGIDYIYEVKLTLVGEGSAGKTSLQARLMNMKAELPKKDSRTRGIKIYDWQFKKHNYKSYIAHIWDFGGQDVYYPVHRFFLTENSVFVLLASTRQTHHNFDYWIPTIYQFGGKSPIIIGQTCHDGNRVPWNDLGYYVGNNDFNIIKLQSLPYIELNLPKRNEGLTKMKEAIIDQIIHLPHYGKGVPKSWFDVRVRIAQETKKNACVTFDKFIEICTSVNSEGFADFIDIEDCAKFLHSIGVILWYYNHEGLREWIILQPDWAMNAVYMIIDDEKIQTRRGNILAEDFDRLWKSNSYMGKFTTLKKMLEVFKIAFPKKHKKNEYIIPARLVSMPNEDRWLPSEPFLRLEYKFQFMPKGLVNQVSAELSRYIINDSFVWNNAVNISNDNGTSQCQIEEDFYNRRISLKAKGKDARGLIMLAMNALKDISEEYKGVKPDIYVPCVCTECITSSKPTTFLYSDLLRWSLKKNEAMVACNESNNTLSIEELLFNVGLATPKQDNIQKMNKTIKLFLASSSELSEERKEFEIFINRENKRLNKHDIFIELNLWEDFVDKISSTRLQDEYNKTVQSSDIVVGLFFSKVGKFTAEEFETAMKQFNKTGKPYIYTYFKDSSISSRTTSAADILSLRTFEDHLKALGHFPTIYNSIEDLKYKFKMQLEKVLDSL